VAEQAFWGIHAKGAKLEEVLLTRHQLAIGWADLGDLTSFAHDRDLIKARLKAAMPNEKPGAIPVYAGELYRFVNELAIGDVVVYRSTGDGTIHLGRVTGPYVYDASHDPAHPNRRPVKWVKTAPVTAPGVTLGALHELGSALAFFKIANNTDVWSELLIGSAAHQEVPGGDEDDDLVYYVSQASEQNTRDFVVKRLAAHLKGHPLAHFVANLLQTMGYRTQVSPAGPDGGIDIVAHRGELGFEPPIVKVQVKSTEGSIGGPTVAELLGNLSGGEYGLIVTLGSFTKDAKSKLKPNIRLIGGDDLVDLILVHYEDLDPRYKSIIPLKRMYVPQPPPDS
jgi:restriction system protein